MLDREIQLKRYTKVILQHDFQISLDIIKEGFSYIDFKHVYNVISNGNNHQIHAIDLKHDKYILCLHQYSFSVPFADGFGLLAQTRTHCNTRL